MVHGWTGKQTAQAFGCSPSHISRVEHGSNPPSRALVQFYEETFEMDGLLLSLFEVTEHHGEQERRRAGGRRPRLTHAVPGDASAFVDDTVPHGTLMTPGEVFVKTWRIRNSGSVVWQSRQLERQGPLTGPGLITSQRYVPIPDTQPGGARRDHGGAEGPDLRLLEHRLPQDGGQRGAPAASRRTTSWGSMCWCGWWGRCRIPRSSQCQSCSSAAATSADSRMSKTAAIAPSFAMVGLLRPRSMSERYVTLTPAASAKLSSVRSIDWR